MNHSHSHSHSHHPPRGHDKTEGRLWITIFLNLGITVAQVVGGLISNSLALISDALHNLSDTSSLVVSLIARKVSKWSPNKEKTFGYKRAEIIGAFINLMMLVFIALFLIKEGVERPCASAAACDDGGRSLARDQRVECPSLEHDADAGVVMDNRHARDAERGKLSRSSRIERACSGLRIDEHDHSRHLALPDRYRERD